jgi:hypothetical protein
MPSQLRKSRWKSATLDGRSWAHSESARTPTPGGIPAVGKTGGTSVVPEFAFMPIFFAARLYPSGRHSTNTFGALADPSCGPCCLYCFRPTSADTARTKIYKQHENERRAQC